MGVYRGGNRKKIRPGNPRVKYEMLTPSQRNFLVKVKRMMEAKEMLSRKSHITINVIGKILRNDNYADVDKDFLEHSRIWYKQEIQ